MNPLLKPTYLRTVELLRDDPRVLAGYMTGSVATSREDEYSDVDPCFLIRRADFEAVDADIPDLFRRAGVEPILLWPERCNSATFRNYAVFFYVDGHLVQYDISVRAADEGSALPMAPQKVIFDSSGMFTSPEPAAEAPSGPGRLRRQVEIYWIYAYIHAKYLRRGDPFKLIAAQQELFQAHLAILHAQRPEVPRDWWPVLAHQVASPEQETTLLSYFGNTSAAQVAEALPEQMGRFASDARDACEMWQVEYPEQFEAAVRGHVEAVLGERRHLTTETRRTEWEGTDG